MRKMTITIDLSVLAWATRARTRGAGEVGEEEEGSGVEVGKVGDSEVGGEEKGASEVGEGMAVGSEDEEAMEVGLGDGEEEEGKGASGAEEDSEEDSTETMMREAMDSRALAEGTEGDLRALEVEVVVVGSETTMKVVTEDSPQEAEEGSGVEGVGVAASGEGEGALVGAGEEGLVVAQV